MKRLKLLLFLFYFLVFFTFGPALPPKVFASNNYIDNIVFKKNSDGLAVVEFHVNTSFDIDVSDVVMTESGTEFCYIGTAGYNVFGLIGSNWFDIIPITDNDYTFNCNTTWHYTAGNTYTGLAIINPRRNQTTHQACVLNNCPQYGNVDYISIRGDLTSTDYITALGQSVDYRTQYPFSDTEDYYFTEYPNLTITWPVTDGTTEIAGDFDITGTITQPSPYNFNKIRASFSFYNEWGANNYIGEFTADISATSSQSFTLPVYGLPVSSPNKIEVLIQLLEVNANGVVVDSYGTTALPWDFLFKTMPEEGAWTPPANAPEWAKYFDIYAPSPSSDGYYHLTAPTSSVEFIYNFPETYKVWIKEDSTTKLATSTFASLDSDYNKRFTVDNFDASSTPSYIYAYITNGVTSDVIITAMFPVKEVGAGEVQNVGLWGSISTFISRTLSNLFIPTPATLNTVINGYKSILTSKIPFSYFYDIYDSFASSTIGTVTSTPNFNIALGGSNISFNVFTIPTELTQTEGWQTFYTFLRYGCYLTFVYYIIARVRGITEEGSD